MWGILTGPDRPVQDRLVPDPWTSSAPSGILAVRRHFREGPMLRSMLLLTLLAQQAPWKTENLQYFPKGIERPALTQRMR